MLEFKVITNTKQLNVTNLQEFEDYLNSELGKRISPVRVVTFLFPWSNVIGVVSLVKLDLKDGTGIVTVELLFEFNPTEETGVLVNDITFETLGYGGREIYVETSWYENNMNNLFCSCESSSLEISQYLQSTITVKCGEVEIPNTEITIYNNGVVAKDINGNNCIGVTNSLGQIEFIFRIW